VSFGLLQRKLSAVRPHQFPKDWLVSKAATHSVLATIFRQKDNRETEVTLALSAHLGRH